MGVYRYEDFSFIGFDLWQGKGGTIFDNVIITDDVAEADAFVAKWKALSEVEKQKKKGADEEKAAAAKKAAEADDDDDDDDERTRRRPRKRCELLILCSVRLLPAVPFLLTSLR